MSERELLIAAALLLPFSVCAALAAEVSPEQLVQTGRRVASGAQTFRADLVVVGRDGEHATGTLTLMRPNYFRLRFRSASGVTEACADGKNLFFSASGGRGCLRIPMQPGAAGAEFLEDLCPPAVAFFSPEWLAKRGALRSSGPIGVATSVGHEQYSGIELLDEATGVRNWYFNEAGFPAGAAFRQGETASIWMQNIRLGIPLRPQDFLFELPQGQKSLLPGGVEERLRPVGSLLPDFKLPGTDGFKIALSDLRKSHKAILVYFEADDSAESREDLPLLQKLGERLRSRQAVVIAVSRHRSTDAVLNTARAAGSSVTHLLDADGTISRAASLSEGKSSAIYLIDPDGRILWAGNRPEVAHIDDALREPSRP